jgi:DGQHR domain-containing protein
MSDVQSSALYGATPFAGISYRIGDRQFVVTVAPVTTYVGMVGEREAWDPLTGTGTNRREDKAHRQRIAAYIQDTEDYVLNSVVIYADNDAVVFVPDHRDAPISPGVLYVRPGAKLKVGDGGHRTSAFGDVIEAHRHGDEVLERLQRNGQPMVVVLDESPANRAQDFVDLQRNAKPLNTSVAESMDRRKAFNRLVLDEVVKSAAIPVFDGGRRVEFLVDSPGKLSTKIAGFKTVRYASGTVLVGTGYRSTASWNEAVELQVALDDHASDRLVEFWQAFSALPLVGEALTSKKGVVGLRQESWLTSANVMYAIAAAVHRCTQDPEGNTTHTFITDAMAALHDLDFRRGANTLYGTLVEPGVSGKPDRGLTGREAWEGAADQLAQHIAKHLGLIVVPTAVA